MIQKKPKVVQAVVDQTIRGWKYALEHPQETVDIVLKYNKDLDKNDQITQLRSVAGLIWQGPTLEGKLGYISGGDFEKAQNVLLDAGLIQKPIEINKAYTLNYWKKTPESYRKVQPDKSWLGLK
jgi:NitT/TauT family transport system substrate-binding protein